MGREEKQTKTPSKIQSFVRKGMQPSILCGIAVKHNLDNVNAINFECLDSTTQQSAEILMILIEQSKLAIYWQKYGENIFLTEKRLDAGAVCWQWFQNQVCLT